jgi:hypothetical protein
MRSQAPDLSVFTDRNCLITFAARVDTLTTPAPAGN